MIQPDQIIRSARKTLSVSIDCFGRVTVRAPMRCATERIFSFLAEKESWIRKKQAEFVAATVALPTDNLQDFPLPILGKIYTICLYEGRLITMDRNENRLYVPTKNAKKRLIAWLKENAERIFIEQTARQAERMHLSYKSVAVSTAKSKWGSCSQDNALRYTFRLLYAPAEVVEYVIIHELAHVKHKNHSPLFWAEVAKYAPDYKARRKWLKNHAALMEIF
jgi:predicted metal-dependent hydrolase